MSTIKKERSRWFKAALRAGFPYIWAQKFASRRTRCGAIGEGWLVSLAEELGFECVETSSYERDDEHYFHSVYRSKKTEFEYDSFYGAIESFRRLGR